MKLNPLVKCLSVGKLPTGKWTCSTKLGTTVRDISPAFPIGS